MKKILIIISISFLFANSILANNIIDEDKFDMGKNIYKETCISCHGVDGKAKTDMNLIVKPRDLTKTILNEEQTYLITKDGGHFWGAKSDIMPAFKYTYNEEQLRAISYYITNNFNPEIKNRLKMILAKSKPYPVNQDKKMKKWGKKIYKRNCSWCHGVTGHGDGVATTSPIDSIFPYDLTKTPLNQNQIFLYIKYGGHYWGTDKTDMPSWSKKYNDFKIYSITRYIDEVLKKNK